MNRKTLVSIHLYLAAFFAPFVIMVAISGGLYLAGVKGSLDSEIIFSGERAPLNTTAPDLQEQVSALLAGVGVGDYRFEYIKVKGDTLYTRPTSRAHYVIRQGEGQMEISAASPSPINALVELHKGHGPGLFKQVQKAFSLGLLIVMLSGLWLGLASPTLKIRTLALSMAGTIIFALAALI